MYDAYCIPASPCPYCVFTLRRVLAKVVRGMSVPSTKELGLFCGDWLVCFHGDDELSAGTDLALVLEEESGM